MLARTRLSLPPSQPNAFEPRWLDAMLHRLAAILKTDRANLPPVFLMNRPKIIAIGIFDDLMILYPEADASALAGWLRWWTNTREYLARMVEGQNRHDLWGDNAGPIDPAHKARAADRLARRKPRKGGDDAG